MELLNQIAYIVLILVLLKFNFSTWKLVIYNVLK